MMRNETLKQDNKISKLIRQIQLDFNDSIFVSAMIKTLNVKY